VDVQKWDVDFYVFSLYKVYGPHYALMFGKLEHLKELPGINHYFIGENEIPYKLQPGSMNYEMSWGSTGIIEYFKDIYSRHFGERDLFLHEKMKMVFSLIAFHEETLIKPLMGFLENREGVKIIGEKVFDKNVRVPTVSFVSEKFKSSEVPPLVDPHKIGIRWGDFYARRLMDDLNLTMKDGVVRISMVHYNTQEEVGKLLSILDEIL
jgi:selenocysteine lyase/cysteine desulfurase